ncbi:Apoptosis-inducing factor 1 [Wickerhamomyces ciferrii]|uniref:Apoptosis-inducing factor 1 n=1 Tax=Wickerhamomyces ciferrii (strain ATCC 14091 / BCRC 22168 / CBS 111 / JCM 3599 / NBRC 0793 / NRRL Y-1031 F-60-10) TaxID=1206466 RepID=K0KPU6_WICCF|nr:Apoptosis-inducing factor 1 [Wickerhamomyces ciferrii]CCH45041.1 Apoptosis-inducing factor 1 [Wickerhamomyces ciferrii]
MGKTVVVVGAGLTGGASANSIKRKLGKNDSVKLITTSDHVGYFPALVRVPFSNNYDAFAPLSEVIDEDVEIIQGRVVYFNESSVSLENGEVIEFDALVIATGSKWPNPISTSAVYGNDYKGFYKSEGEKIKNANDIVFIGGGFVNVEFVGELYHIYKDDIESGKKRVSIIQNSDKLLPDSPFYTDKFRTKITQWFDETEIKLYLKSKGEITESDKGQVIINGNQKIKADLIYIGIGVQPIVPKNEISELTNDKGFIRTNKNFKVKANSKGNIFAIGDVTDFQYHGVQKLHNWIPTIASNVTSYLQDGSNAKLIDASTFENENIPAGVSLGPNDGFGQYPFPLIGTVILPRFLIAMAKSKDLFVSSWRKMTYDN